MTGLFFLGNLWFNIYNMGEANPGARSEIARMREILETPEEIKAREVTARDFRFGAPEEIKDHLLDTAARIDAIKPAGRPNAEQKQELREAKEKFFNYLLEAIKSAGEYHKTVVALENKRRSLFDPYEDEKSRRAKQQEAQESDLRRRRKHNAMMDKMRLAKEN
jgi:hypothetical protein